MDPTLQALLAQLGAAGEAGLPPGAQGVAHPAPAAGGAPAPLLGGGAAPTPLLDAEAAAGIVDLTGDDIESSPAPWLPQNGAAQAPRFPSTFYDIRREQAQQQAQLRPAQQPMPSAPGPNGNGSALASALQQLGQRAGVESRYGWGSTPAPPVLQARPALPPGALPPVPQGVTAEEWAVVYPQMVAEEQKKQAAAAAAAAAAPPMPPPPPGVSPAQWATLYPVMIAFQQQQAAAAGDFNPQLLASGAYAAGVGRQVTSGMSVGRGGPQPQQGFNLPPGVTHEAWERAKNMEVVLRQMAAQTAQRAQTQARLPGAPLPTFPPPQQTSVAMQKGFEAFVKALESTGEKDGDMSPPEHLMDTILLPHQKTALAWMSRRENGSSQPFGGILADDQGLGKTVTTIALIVCNPRHGTQRVPIPLPEKEAQGAREPRPAAPGASAPAADSDVVIIDDDEDEEGDEGRSSSDAHHDEVAERPAATQRTASGAPGPSAGGAAPLDFGTLVVCPTTLLHQWEAEVRSKTSRLANARVFVYHGKSKGVSNRVLASYDVVITTYQTLVQEMPEGKKPATKKGGSTADLGAAGAADDGKKRKREAGGGGERGGPLFQVMWHRVVLDEAQMIKNSRTLAAHAAWALRARRRWCLSGTPIQNVIDDLYSYFRFLRFEPYSKFTVFKELIKDPIAGDDPRAGYDRLNAILRAILRRRTKQSRNEAGELLVPLQQRNVRLLQKEFSPEERAFYDRLTAEAEAKFNEIEAEAEEGGGGRTGGYVNMLWMLLRMRQACSHPSLVNRGAAARGGGGAAAAAGPAKTEAAAAKKLKPDVRSQLAATLRGMHECVTCFDVPEDPVVSVCGHVFCRQCVSAQLSMAGQGAAEAELAFHCPSCGHTLGPHQTFGAAVLDVPAEGGAEGSANGNAEGPVRVDGSSTKVDALMELLRELREDGGGGGGNGGGEVDMTQVVRSVSQKNLRAEMDRRSAGTGLKGGRGAVASRGASPGSVRLREKVIVFSQWTGMLDLIEIPLKREGIEFRRLDGTMTASARQAAIQEFSSGPWVSVMLVSLKAASVGVNLVCANHVVLMDLWYNPSAEDQAIDRAHRIGQTRDVQVTRITVKDTVEDRILELQAKKKEIVDRALGEDGAGGTAGTGRGAGLSREDLVFMFRGSRRR